MTLILIRSLKLCWSAKVKSEHVKNFKKAKLSLSETGANNCYNQTKPGFICIKEQ